MRRMPVHLTGIAIIGKNNEPLYLLDCGNKVAFAGANNNNISNENNNKINNDNNNNNTSHNNDPFDFHSLSQQPRNSLPLNMQLVVFAALDGLEEAVSTGQTKQQPIIKNPNISMPNWVGFLMELDGQAVYATVSATNIKFMALTQGKASNAKEIHLLLKEIHQHFIAYIMNPFANTRGPVNSQLFDEKVQASVDKVKAPVIAVVD